jgi:putative hydrolase of the HAD superfamily
MIRLLIFDVGGVIIDYSEDDYMRYISKKLGLDMLKFARAMNPLIVKMEYGRLEAEDAESELSKRFHVPELDLEWVIGYKKLARLNKQVASLMARLGKHYRVVLLSNISASRYIESKRLFLNNVKHDRTFASCYLHMRKPERRIYLHVLKEMHVRPKEAIFIDNMQENVEGARKAGIESIRFTDCAQLIKALRRHSVNP